MQNLESMTALLNLSRLTYNLVCEFILDESGFCLWIILLRCLQSLYPHVHCIMSNIALIARLSCETNCKQPCAYFTSCWLLRVMVENCLYMAIYQTCVRKMPKLDLPYSDSKWRCLKKLDHTYQ